MSQRNRTPEDEEILIEMCYRISPLLDRIRNLVEEYGLKYQNTTFVMRSDDDGLDPLVLSTEDDLNEILRPVITDHIDKVI